MTSAGPWPVASWRVSEQTLLWTALAGGTPGAFVASQINVAPQESQTSLPEPIVRHRIPTGASRCGYIVLCMKESQKYGKVRR